MNKFSSTPNPQVSTSFRSLCPENTKDHRNEHMKNSEKEEEEESEKDESIWWKSCVRLEEYEPFRVFAMYFGNLLLLLLRYLPHLIESKIGMRVRSRRWLRCRNSLYKIPQMPSLLTREFSGFSSFFGMLESDWCTTGVDNIPHMLIIARWKIQTRE